MGIIIRPEDDVPTESPRKKKIVVFNEIVKAVLRATELQCRTE